MQSDFIRAAEPILETSYYLADFADEVVVHEPSLEGAAEFLRIGSDDNNQAAHENGGRFPPYAQHGDIVELDALQLFADRTAVKGQDGAWSLLPAPPADAHFFAERYNDGEGWDSDSILSDAPSNNEFDAIADGEDEIHNIACGRTGSLLARYIVEGETSRLELLTAEESTHELWRIVHQLRLDGLMTASERRESKLIFDDAAGEA